VPRHKDFILEVGEGPKADEHVDLPEGMHPLAGVDPVEWHDPGLDLGSPDPQEFQRVYI
jgi:hypothetical protein